MAWNLNEPLVPDFIDKIPRLKRCVSRIRGAVFIPALKGLEGEMKGRIHNDGKAANGSAIGRYRSDQYKKKRQKEGRQIAFKDLQFKGDLIRAYTVGFNGLSPTLGFTTDKQRLIAEGQERQTGKTIFAISDKERRNLYKSIARDFRKEIIKCLR